jgi:hypothetical protein
MNEFVTAIELAQSANVDPKKLRAALRRQEFPWHKHGEHWTVERNGSEHRDMLRVLSRLKS